MQCDVLMRYRCDRCAVELFLKSVVGFFDDKSMNAPTVFSTKVCVSVVCLCVS